MSVPEPLAGSICSLSGRSLSLSLSISAWISDFDRADHTAGVGDSLALILGKIVGSQGALQHRRDELNLGISSSSSTGMRASAVWVFLCFFEQLDQLDRAVFQCRPWTTFAASSPLTDASPLSSTSPSMSIGLPSSSVTSISSSFAIGFSEKIGRQVADDHAHRARLERVVVRQQRGGL